MVDQLRWPSRRQLTDYQPRWEVSPHYSEKVSTLGLVILHRADPTEVLSIIASPTLSSDVRHRASGLLRNLHGAYTRDKASRTSATISPLSQAEADALEADIESGKVDDRVEERAVRTDGVLRVHRIYMDRRREFEVRVGTEGKMTLWDGKEAKMWT